MRPSDPVQHARRVAARVVRAGPASLPYLRATVGVRRVCMGGTGTQMGLSEIAWVAKRARRGLLHVTRTIAVWSRSRRDRSRSHPTSGITAPRAARGVPYLGHHRAGPGPRCADHSDARGRPDPPTCAGYRTHYTASDLAGSRWPALPSVGLSCLTLSFRPAWFGLFSVSALVCVRCWSLCSHCVRFRCWSAFGVGLCWCVPGPLCSFLKNFTPLGLLRPSALLSFGRAPRLSCPSVCSSLSGL